MAQPNNTVNYLVHDANGQPQVVKFHSVGKSISGIMAGIGGQPVIKLKTGTSQESNESFTPVIQSGPIMKTPTKIITKTIPLGTMAQTFQKAPDGQLIKKTIRLTPQQVQNLKFINSSSQKFHVQQPQQTAVKQQVPSSPVMMTPPTILDHSGSRKRQDSSTDLDFTPENKRRKTEKVGKGLRHFSMKVCEKVRKKGTTTYNEVADELVAEFTNSSINNSLAEQYDQKNIRRRVYDALNVLMAMNIISKEKKEIKWIGLPSNSVQECMQLEKEKQKKIRSIQEKRKNLQELILNQISFKNLTQRNMELEAMHGRPAPNSFIQLPFIVVNTNRKTIIDCSISQDKMEYLFHFNDKFEIHDDLEILKQIGMLMGLDEGTCSPENLEKIKTLVPKSLEEYVIQMANGKSSTLDFLIENGAGPSNLGDELIDSQLEEDNNSRQSSSCDPLSPSQVEYSDDDVDSDISSDD